MSSDAAWHVVYSTPAEMASRTQQRCTPIVGGNYIEIDDVDDENNVVTCSYGFQAKKGSTWGWITAGHCADGQVYVFCMYVVCSM